MNEKAERCDKLIELIRTGGKRVKEISGAYLDTSGACKELGISIATLYRFLKKRKKNGIPAHRLGGNWRFIKEELTEWVRDQV